MRKEVGDSRYFILLRQDEEEYVGDKLSRKYPYQDIGYAETTTGDLGAMC